jgi:hypothetical protein
VLSGRFVLSLRELAQSAKFTPARYSTLVRAASRTCVASLHEAIANEADNNKVIPARAPVERLASRGIGSPLSRLER